MSRKPDNVFKLSETLTLCEYESGGDKGFWLYDKVCRMNLAIRSKRDIDALVSALTYYQNRLIKVETSYRELKTNVDEFVERFAEDHS